MANQKQNTPGLGIEYEIFVPAYFALKLNNHEDVKNFSIRSNVATEFGNMDDVIVDIELCSNHSLHFAFQLKHKENAFKNLQPGNFESQNGDFSLEKYCKEFKKLKNENKTKYHFILYTNANFDSIRTKEMTKFVMSPDAQYNGDIFFNTSLNSKNIYKFQANDLTFSESQVKNSDFDEFLSKFSLYACQKNYNDLEGDILKILKNQNVTSLYTNLFRKWHQGSFTNKTIDKETLNIHLVDIFLSPFIIADRSFFSGQDDSLELFEAAVRQFDVTVINDFREGFCDNLPKITNFEKSTDTEMCMLQLAREYKFVVKNTNKLDDNVKLKLLCYFFECVLIVDFNSNSDNLIYQLMKLYQIEKNKIKFVLLGKGIHTEKLSPLQVFENLEDLAKVSNSLYQQIINECRISLQGRDKMPLKQLLDSLKEVCSLTETKELFQMLNNHLLIGEEPDLLPQYYISRRVTTTILDVHTVLDFAKKGDNLMIVNFNAKFENIQNIFEKEEITIKKPANYLKQVQPVQNVIIYVTNEEEGREVFKQIRDKYTTMKICFLKMVTKSVFIPIMSTSLLFDIRKTDLKKQIGEENIHNFFTGPVNILCDQPGMGKTTIMTYLKNNHCTESWTVSVDLKAHNSFLEQKHSIEEVLNYFTKPGQSNTFSQKLKEVFQRRKKVVFYFDGLDELEPVCIENILNYIEAISLMGFRVWVSSRQNLEERLKSKFNIFVIEMVELTEQEQKMYVQNRLQSQYNIEEVKKLKDAIFNSCHIVNNRHILGIPLQLYIITQIFLDEKQHHLSLKKNLFILTVMYKIYFDGRYRHAVEKLKPIAPFSMLSSLEDYLENYEVAALQSMLDDDVFSQLQLDLRKNQRFLNRIKTDKDPLGIIVKLNKEGKAVYEHYTFAEYFACVFLSNNFDKAKLLKSYLFSSRYKNLILILNIMLAEENPLHLAVIYKNLDQVKEYLNDDNIHDKGGRNPLHVAAGLSNCSFESIKMFVQASVFPNYAIKGPYFNEVFSENREEEASENKSIIKKVIKFDPYERDCLFGEDALHYGIANNNLFAIETILENSGMTHKGLEDLRKYEYSNSATIAYYSTLWGYPNLLAVALDKKNSSITKMRKNDIIDKGLLHVAATCHSSTNLQIMNLLIDYGVAEENQSLYANINKIYYPLLHTAIESKNVQIVKFLLKTQNEPDIWALYTAIKIQHLEICQILLKDNEDIYVKALVVQHFQLSLPLLRESEHFLTFKKGDSLLHYVVRIKNIAIIRFFLSKNLDLNLKNYYSETLLMIAVKDNSFTVTKFFVNKGADVNDSDDEGSTPLMEAIKNNNLDIVKLLIENGANLEPNKTEVTPLHLAVRNASFDIVKLLLDNGANPDAATQGGGAMLHWAVLGGNINTVNLFLEIHDDLNVKNSEGKTPLFLASLAGHSEIVKILLERGASLEESSSHDTLLHAAAEGGNCKIISLLLDEGMNINARNTEGATPLLLAAQKKHVDAVTFLIERGADFNCICNDQLDLWTIAFKYLWTFKPVISLMLKKGANPNRRIIVSDDYKKTPLAFAIRFNYLDIMRLLLDHGANVDDILAFREAVLNGRPQFLDLLLSKGYRLNANKKEEQRTYQVASERRQFKSINLLLKRGASLDLEKLFYLANCCEMYETAKLCVERKVDLNIVSDEGETALHLVQSKRNASRGSSRRETAKNFLEFLLSKNANPNLKNRKGETPLCYAVKGNDHDMVNLLIENGAQASDLKAFVKALEMKHIQICKLLLDRGYKVESKQEDAVMPAAGKSGSFEMTDFFLKNGLSVNAANSEGETALSLAAKNKHYNVVKLLVTKGADVNCISKTKETIWKYIDWNDRRLINLILRKSIRPCLKNKHDKTPLYYAIKNGSVDFVTSMLKRDSVHKDNTQALIEAVYQNNIDMIYLLVQNGYKLTIEIKDQARQLFERRRHKTFLRLLNNHKMILGDDYIYMALHLAVYLGDCSIVSSIKKDIDFESVDVYNEVYPLHFAVENRTLHHDLLLKMTAWIDNQYREKEIWKLENMRRYLLDRFPLDLQASRRRKHKYIYLTKTYDLLKKDLLKTFRSQ